MIECRTKAETRVMSSDVSKVVCGMFEHRMHLSSFTL